MKFDKETAIVVMVCIVLITLWSMFYPQKKIEQQPQTAAPAAAAPAKPEPAATTAVVPSPAPTVKKIAAATPRAASLTTDFADYYFDSNGNLHRVEVKHSRRTGTEDLVSFIPCAGNEPFFCTIPGWEFRSAKISKAGGTVTIDQLYEAGTKHLTLKKVFTADKESPVLKCTVSFEGDASVLDQVIMWGGTLAPLKQFSNDGLRDVHQAEYMLAGNGKVVTADPAVKKQEKFLKKRTDQAVRWIAVSNKYFLTQLYANSHPFNGGCDLVNHLDSGHAEPGIAGIYRNVPVPAQYQFLLYSGTKAIDQITQLPEDAAKAIHLAYWGWLEPLCRPMLALLNFLKGITGSYGWAIVLLTVLVKLVLWPLIHKGNKSMRRMQKVQPMIAELKEKYKDNPQLFNQKMMELYRQEKVSPLGGCFPMLLQFPVFVALYSTLDSAVELRHVPFLWAADLSRPDAVGPEIFGLSIHPFILISTGLMVLQMKLSPQTGDPMQRKMMMFMPLFMLIFFYSFPSGLALYWTVNNILSILQMKYSQYAARKEEEREASSGKDGSAKAV